MSVLGIGLGMMQGHQNERRNYRNERNLANQQYGNQRMLNKQGHDLQMDMWNKTNYGAQVGHMKDAGLNPALMYGSAGQGGTTGSQGGGSASKGNSQMNKGVDPNAMLLKAQMDNLNSISGLNKAKEDDLRGKTPLGEALVTESGVRSALGESNINLNNEQIQQVKANIDKLNADASLTRKIEEMNYGGEFGTNMTQNIVDIVSGKLDLSTYIGLASGIAGLTVLRSGKMVSKIGSRGLAGVKGAIDKLKGKLKRMKNGNDKVPDVTQQYINKLNKAKNIKN
jgi:hypothetical protein